MVEALWVQASGVSYSAQEDRRLITAIFTEGVINGLVLNIGTGLNTNVTAGNAVVDDDSGYGSYLAALDSTTPIAITANTTENIYLTVDPTTGVCSLAAGSAPANPYLVLGSATAGASSITSVTGTSSRQAASFRAQGSSGAFIRKAGESGIGDLSMNNLDVLGSAYVLGAVHAGQGIYLGSANNPTRRANASVYRNSTSQSLPAGTQTPVSFNTVYRNISDYASNIYNGVNPDRFYAPVSGVYLFSGQLAGMAYIGTGRIGGVIYQYLGSQIVASYGLPNVNSADADPFSIYFNQAVTMSSGQYLRILVSPSIATAHYNSTATLTLLQAD